MSVPGRLAGFAALLALVFAAAALAGSLLDADPVGAAAEDAGKAGGHAPGAAGAAGGHAPGAAGAAGGHGEAGMAPQPVRGLAVAGEGLALELARRTAPLGERAELAFRIRDARGRIVRGFDVEHTKRMHLIVVRRDMTGFQHLHPAQRPDGTWSVPLTLRDAGTYRVFADFSVDGEPHTLADDLAVDGSVRARALPAPAAGVTVDGLQVRRAGGAARAGTGTDLGFTVTRDGEPVALEDHLGAKGHLVALRQGDLAFLHVHPDERRPTFAATFPTAGRYRLFLQFKTAGRVHTAAFTQEVAR